MGSSNMDQRIQEQKSPQDNIHSQMRSLVSELMKEVLEKATDRNPSNLWTEHLFIRERLDKLTSLQATLADTDKNIAKKRTGNCLEEFLNWGQRKGIKLDGVKVAKDPLRGGYKLEATRNITKGEMLVIVPRKVIFCLDQVRRSALLKKLFARDHIASSMDNVGLAMGLCCQQLKEDSMWRPYLEVLPPTYHSPLFYTIEQLQELKPSPAFEEALSFYRVIARQFCYYLTMIDENNTYDRLSAEARRGREAPPLYGGPFTIDNFTHTLYKWAVCAVTTRINHIPSEYEKDSKGEPRIIPCMIPALDFANHSFFDDFKLTPGYCDSQDVAGLPANVDLQPGQPVDIEYGRRTTIEFLIHNAFVPETNPYNKYRLKIGIPKTDKYLMERADRLYKIGFAKAATVYVFDVFHASEPGAMPFTKQLVDFALVFVANPPIDEEINSEANLAKAVQFIHTRFCLLLRGYSGKELDRTTPFGILLSQEQAILSEALAYCEKWKQDLHL